MTDNGIPAVLGASRATDTQNVVVTLGDCGFVVTREEMEDGLGGKLIIERFETLTALPKGYFG